jgi:hypothetical protein
MFEFLSHGWRVFCSSRLFNTFSVVFLILKIPDIIFVRYFWASFFLRVFFVLRVWHGGCGGDVRVTNGILVRRLSGGGRMRAHCMRRSVRMHGADGGRSQWSRGLRAAAAGCRRRHEYQVQCARARCGRVWGVLFCAEGSGGVYGLFFHFDSAEATRRDQIVWGEVLILGFAFGALACGDGFCWHVRLHFEIAFSNFS